MTGASSDAPAGRLSSLLKTRILREGAWVASGQIISALAALISIRIMTELLRPEEFGRITLLVGVAALALGLTANPHLQAMIRYYPEWRMNGRVDVLRRVATGLIATLVAVAVLVLVGGWGVAALTSDANGYVGLLVAALLVVDVLRSFELAFFNAARRQRSAAIVQVADAWSRPLLAMLAVLAFGSSAEAALAGYIAGSLLVVVVMHMMTRLEGADPVLPAGLTATNGQLGTDQLSKAIKRYALPLAPLAIFGWISGMGDRYVIGGLLGMAEVGLYAAAYGLASRPFLMLSGIIEQTLRPVLQNAIATGDGGRIAQAKRAMLATTTAGAVFGVLCFVVLNDVVAGLLLAEEYRVAAGLMPWVALGYALLTISNVFSRFCYAFDATGSVLMLTVAGALIGIAVLVPAVMWHGLRGAVIAVPVRFGVELALSALLAGRAERRFLANNAVTPQ